MDLSQEVQDVLKAMKVLIKENAETTGNTTPRLPLDRSRNSMADDLIDINNINYTDDENWLYELPVRNSDVQDLKVWLYQDITQLKDFNFHNHRLSLIRELAHTDSKKIIDSRTFTRPKKRITRPSIEAYNDGYFRMDKGDAPQIIDNTMTDETESTKTLLADSIVSNECDDNINDVVAQAEQKPLKFDFSQPTSSSIFESIISAAPDIESFQNMSPPSLMNSMCSSTFTNLMENSMIRNDPLLREISVTDYTEAMLQDYDPPLFKSITDSYSSINLDNPESFIKQNSEGTLNGIYKKNVLGNNDGTYTADKSDGSVLDGTYLKGSSTDVSSVDVCYNDNNSYITSEQQKSPKPDTTRNLNGTYRKSLNSKLNETYQKAPLFLSNDNLNTAINYNNDSNRFTSPKRRSFIIDRRNELNQTTDLKRNSFGHSGGSSDSLDYLSSLSSGSRDSNKMLNMAEVDAIVLQQEQSLQVMSTPNTSSKIISKLWENSVISPVTALDREDVSDSDRSSNDEYRTVRSHISSTCATSESASSTKTTNKTLENYVSNAEMIKAKSPKSLNLHDTKTISNNKKPDIRGSYSNLKTVGRTLKGSYTNLKPIGASIKGANSISSQSNKGSTSNLKTMSTHLKGSYTQLKPVLLNLPCTDTNSKMYNSKSTAVIKRPNNNDLRIKIAEVTPTLRDPTLKNQVKPAAFTNSYAKLQSKASGLPRPISCIPRPSVSKIPGPRSRPSTARTLSRPISRNDLDYDF